MAEIVNKKIEVDLNIRSANIKVNEPMDIYIAWKRGNIFI
jgi:hypothetical protein